MILALAGCKSETAAGQGRRPGGPGGGGPGGPGGGRPAIAVQTGSTQKITVERLVDVSGTLLSPDQAKVSAEVAGIVRQVPIEIGREVKVGDVLVRLEPRELSLALDRAESALRQVEAQLGIDRSQDRQPPADEQIASVRQAIANRDDARAAFARAQALNGRGLLSQVDRDTAETRLKVTEANFQASLDTVHALKASLQDRRAAFELAQKKLTDASIKAPVAGSVSERLVQPGEFIRENTQVATIVAMSPLKLKTAVQEKFAAVIKAGQPVRFAVEAFPGKSFDGKVAYVSPAVDQTTRTFTIEALVDNADRQLKPGFFARGTISTRVDENVVAAPDDAISTLAGVSTVYVIENGKARQQQVTLGTKKDKLVEIVSGLKGDETLATSNLNQLATGVTVRLGGEEAAAGAGGGPGGGSGGRGGGGRGGQGGGQGRGQGRVQGQNGEQGGQAPAQPKEGAGK